MKIKDAVEGFFHNQGITIVTIQPEFKVKSNGKLIGVVPECLIGCQSLECAPKTCCSTSDLHETVSPDNELENTKSARKSGSLLSLNINSLAKLRKTTRSTQDIIKKSVSESHVTHIGNEDNVVSQNPSTNVPTSPSAANNLDVLHSSIDELIETESSEHYKEHRVEKSTQLVPQQHMNNESNIEQEDSSLLKLVPENDSLEKMQPLDVDIKYETHST